MDAGHMGKQKTQKPNQQESAEKQHRIRGTLIGLGTGALAIVLGAGSGYLFHTLTDKKETITVNASDLAVDEDALMSKYKASKDYSALEPWEMVNIALILHGQANNSFWYSSGTAIAMGLVKQNIHSSGIHSGGEWFEESHFRQLLTNY